MRCDNLNQQHRSRLGESLGAKFVSPHAPLPEERADRAESRKDATQTPRSHAETCAAREFDAEEARNHPAKAHGNSG